MKITRVLHVSVNTQNTLAAAQDFYREVFGLSSQPRADIPGIAGHWFALGGAELHLVDAPTGDGPIRPTGNHFCVGVADLDAAIAELDEKHITYARGAQGDVVQIWIADPAGNTIELQQDASR